MGTIDFCQTKIYVQRGKVQPGRSKVKAKERERDKQKYVTYVKHKANQANAQGTLN